MIDLRGHHARSRRLTIRELAGTIARHVGFDGRFTFDTSRPDGTPRKLRSRGYRACGRHGAQPVHESISRL